MRVHYWRALSCIMFRYMIHDSAFQQEYIILWPPQWVMNHNSIDSINCIIIIFRNHNGILYQHAMSCYHAYLDTSNDSCDSENNVLPQTVKGRRINKHYYNWASSKELPNLENSLLEAQLGETTILTTFYHAAIGVERFCMSEISISHMYHHVLDSGS